MQDEMRKRKTMRRKNFDYSSAAEIFLTICVKDRRRLLSDIVGTDVLGGPNVRLLPYGVIAEKYIQQLGDFYEDVEVCQYVIMPDHIHLLLFVKGNGPPRTSVPTEDAVLGAHTIDTRRSVISRFVSTFKRFCNREYGENIWQARSYDHIIRNQYDHEETVRYIAENPWRWYIKQQKS